MSLIGCAAAWTMLPRKPIESEAFSSSSNRKLFSRSEVSSHSTKENRIWVSFESGVYDITDFVDIHPGIIYALLIF